MKSMKILDDLRRLIFAIAISITIFVNLISAQSILHVPSEYSTIQYAIDMAQNGDVVLVADGV